MHTFLPALVAFTSVISAASIPYTHQQLHEKRATSNIPNPINVQSAPFLCNVASDLPLKRDLGFVGSIEYTIIYTYGDTMTGDGPTFYMTSDSSSIGTNDPCHVLNTQRTSDNQHATDMIAPSSTYSETNTQDAFGGTNVIPTGGDKGVMFYLVNHRPGGSGTIVGAGVAEVSLSGHNVTTRRLAKNQWDASAGEPWYGDVGAYTDGAYVYGYGHGGDKSMHVYVNRAPISSWSDVSAWEYWDGSKGAWTKDRLKHPSPAQALQWNAAEGPVYAVGQGQMVWSPYYNKILWVYGIDWADDYTTNSYGVYARTADTITGPWSPQVRLFSVQATSSSYAVYCPIANPYYDITGKTLIVTVDAGSSTVRAHKVTFA